MRFGLWTIGLDSFLSNVSDDARNKPVQSFSLWDTIKFDDDIMDNDIQSVSSTPSEAWSTERTSGE